MFKAMLKKWYNRRVIYSALRLGDGVLVHTNRILSQQEIDEIVKEVKDFMNGHSEVLVMSRGVEITVVARPLVRAKLITQNKL